MQVPTQGPIYFPMDRVGSVGQDPISLLNRNNTGLPASRTNLVNSANQNGSYGSISNNVKNKNPYPATGNTSDSEDSDRQSPLKLGRILGLVISLIACAICLVGIINIIYAALSLAPNAWGCLNMDGNQFKSTLGPSSPAMVILTWIWISVGMWAAIPPFVAGVALFRSRKPNRKLDDSSYNPGLPMELQNSQNNYTNAPDIYRIFAIFSIIFCLPICFVVAIIDTILSNYCASTGNTVKFILPIIVVLLAIVEFVLILFSWYKSKDASDSEYQYIGSTYTVYETYEPIYREKNPLITPEPTSAPTIATQHCCGGSTNPIVIVNQPPVNQTQPSPINVLVRNEEFPQRPVTMSPPPRPVVRVPVPIKVPFRVPISVPQPIKPVRRRLITQQRYYPSQVYGPNFGNRPNTYGGMYLPTTGPDLVTSPYTQFNRRF